MKTNTRLLTSDPEYVKRLQALDQCPNCHVQIGDLHMYGCPLDPDRNFNRDIMVQRYPEHALAEEHF